MFYDKIVIKDSLKSARSWGQNKIIEMDNLESHIQNYVNEVSGNLLMHSKEKSRLLTVLLSYSRYTETIRRFLMRFTMFGVLSRKALNVWSLVLVDINSDPLFLS